MIDPTNWSSMQTLDRALMVLHDTIVALHAVNKKVEMNKVLEEVESRASDLFDFDTLASQDLIRDITNIAEQILEKVNVP